MNKMKQRIISAVIGIIAAAVVSELIPSKAVPAK